MVTFLPSHPIPVEGLGLSSDDVPWLGRAAVEEQARQARRAGLAMGPSSDCITVTAGSVATERALVAFRRASESISGDVVAQLPDAVARWAEWSCFGEPASLVRLRGGGQLTEERLSGATPVAVDVPVHTLPVPMGEGVIALSPALVLPIGHWSGVLWANLLSLAPTLYRELVAPPPTSWRQLPGAAWGVLRIAWAIARAGSLDKMRVAGRLNRWARDVRVHPSAVVEGCVLGKGVSIGPGAVVRGCILGEGARVEAQALVTCSVLGREAVVQRRGWIQFGVLAQKSAHAGAAQLCVLSREASVKGGSYLMDQALEGSVEILRAGARHPVPLGMIGACVGRSTTIGSGVWVAPGRAVPSESFVIRPPETVVTRTPAGLQGTLVVRDGTLTPE